jgi:hypothetical protein
METIQIQLSWSLKIPFSPLMMHGLWTNEPLKGAITVGVHKKEFLTPKSLSGHYFE